MTTLPTSPGAEILPGYSVVELLDRGRRVDTYDVYSNLRQCRCVVKIIRPDRIQHTRVREAVIREGTLLRDLTHPHLVRGYEVITDPLPAMVLETLPGATLEAVIDDAPLTPADTAHLGLQLASVLQYLHQHQWLHLDVKPANVVVNTGRAILFDLSIANRPGPGRPGAGTDGYLSPEQATGDNLGPETDVWSLAVTLIEAVTGHDPVGATVKPTRLWRISPLRKAARALDAVRDLPRPVRHTLLACLDPAPAARPNLTELRGSLACALRDAEEPDLTAVDAYSGLRAPRWPRGLLRKCSDTRR